MPGRSARLNCPADGRNRPMKLVLRWLAVALITAFSLGSAASAVPITFQLDNVTIENSSFPAGQTYDPALPIVGSGNIDFDTGTGVVPMLDSSSSPLPMPFPGVESGSFSFTASTSAPLV